MPSKCMPLNNYATNNNDLLCSSTPATGTTPSGCRCVFPSPAHYSFPSFPVQPPVSAEHEYGCCVWTSVSRDADSEHLGLPRGSECMSTSCCTPMPGWPGLEVAFSALQVVVGGTILTLMCGSIVFFCLFPQFWDKLSPPAQALKDAHAENEANKKAEDGASGSSDMVDEYDDWGRKVVAPGETGL